MAANEIETGLTATLQNLLEGHLSAADDRALDAARTRSFEDAQVLTYKAGSS
jgi:hypothetical protein